jgi:hypothetical protein
MNIMLRFQEKNHSEGRLRLEMDTYTRYNLTQRGTRFVLENLQKPQVDQDSGVKTGRMELTNMESNALFNQWDKIMMGYVFYETTDAKAVVKTFYLLPKDVHMYSGKKDCYLLTVDQCVVVEVESGPPNKRLRFTRIKNIKNGEDIVRQQTAEVELITSDGINRLDKFVNTVCSMREILYSTPKSLFEPFTYRPIL